MPGAGAADVTQAPPDAVVDDVPLDQIDAGDDVPVITPDVAPPSDVVTAPVCPGAAGCDCATNQQCDSSVCIPTPDGSKCAQPCTTDCPAGFSCKPVGGSDATFMCLPNFLALCSPCKTSSECATSGIDALCLDYGAAGHYCGSPCAVDADCPDAYQCAGADASGGKLNKQCRLKPVMLPGAGTDCTACATGETCVNGKCATVQPGQCACSKWAISNAMTTECSNANSLGSCKAQRKCLPDGLQACNAKEPKAEVCNAADDDCDGTVDNLAIDFKCYKTAFQDGGSGAACKSDAECPAVDEACDPDTSLCRKLIGKCPGKPSCAATGALICNDAKSPKLESCNGEDDDCDSQIDEDFGWPLPTDPSSVVPIGKACGLGPCAGGKVQCKSLNEAWCSTEVKSVKETCDGQDSDCDGATDDLACDDSDACSLDVCEPSKGKCSHTPVLDCDDNNQCTTDTCNALTGQCEHDALGGACEDGDKCTVGDLCKATGVDPPICVPGAAAAKCDDANLCTDDSCAADLGCVHLPNAVTQACYGADVKTKGIGTCVGGTRYCQGGTLGSVCVGEVTPNKGEICDALDDNCNGSTDEGCTAAGVQLTFSAATFDVPGDPTGTHATVFLAGSTPMDQVKGDTKSAVLGFLAWLLTYLK